MNRGFQKGNRLGCHSKKNLTVADNKGSTVADNKGGANQSKSVLPDEHSGNSKKTA